MKEKSESDWNNMSYIIKLHVLDLPSCRSENLQNPKTGRESFVSRVGLPFPRL